MMRNDQIVRNLNVLLPYDLADLPSTELLIGQLSLPTAMALLYPVGKQTYHPRLDTPAVIALHALKKAETVRQRRIGQCERNTNRFTASISDIKCVGADAFANHFVTFLAGTPVKAMLNPPSTCMFLTT